MGEQMDNPTFHIKGIIRAKEDMEDFEGPLTLLMQLLSKNKVEIRDLQIHLLCDQYIEYLEEMKRMDLEIASEFVQMASHLLYLKTKTLLAGEEEVPELELLMNSMEALQRKESYLRIKGAAEVLLLWRDRGAGYGVKPPEALPAAAGYRYSHSLHELVFALQRLQENRNAAGSVTPGRPLIIPARIIYSVEDKTRELLSRLQNAESIALDELLLESRSRSELVATFLSVLELCRTGQMVFALAGAAVCLHRV